MRGLMLARASLRPDVREDAAMRISAKADYAVRAAMGLALVGGSAKAEHIAQRHAIPLKFLEKILFDLRHAGLVATRRGPEGGYWLARDPAQITVADVLRAVDGPLADVHGLAPEDVEYEEGFAALQKVWVAVRTNLRTVLESITIADLAGRHAAARGRAAHARARLLGPCAAARSGAEAPPAWRASPAAGRRARTRPP